MADVVFHEFAHQLGPGGGEPRSAIDWPRREPSAVRIAQYSSWARDMAAEYDLFCKASTEAKKQSSMLMEHRIRRSFCCCHGCFFEKAEAVLQKHSALYSICKFTARIPLNGPINR